MKRFAFFAVLMLVAEFAQAEVFKCKTPNGIVYSEHPCATDAEAVHVQAKEPTAEDAQAARQRLVEDARANANAERQSQSQTYQQTWVYQQQYRTMPQMPQMPQTRVVTVPIIMSSPSMNSYVPNSNTPNSNSRVTVSDGRTTGHTAKVH